MFLDVKGQGAIGQVQDPNYAALCNVTVIELASLLSNHNDVPSPPPPNMFWIILDNCVLLITAILVQVIHCELLKN